MKVGTDAMLLGSWAEASSSLTMLDIGTGCGVLSMMLAQESGAMIHAIDIDRNSVEEARKNFSSSPWADRLSVFHRSLEEHSSICEQTYDLIISNPPFFTDSLKPGSEKRLLARHKTTLTNRSLLTWALKLMHPGSSLCLILPFGDGQALTEMFGEKGILPERTLIVKPLPSKPPHRILLDFRLTKNPKPVVDELSICTTENRFSDKYLLLTQNFHYFEKKKT